MGLDLITEKLKGARSLNRQLESGSFFKKILKKNEKTILDWNRNEQLFRDGIYNDGTKIPDYMARTVDEFKIPKGQPYDRVTMRDTGDFHKSFYLDFKKDSVMIYAKDSKTSIIIKPYRYGFGPRGPKVLGLTDENRRRLLEEIIKPALFNEVRTKLYGKQSAEN